MWGSGTISPLTKHQSKRNKDLKAKWSIIIYIQQSAITFWKGTDKEVLILVISFHWGLSEGGARLTRVDSTQVPGTIPGCRFHYRIQLTNEHLDAIATLHITSVAFPQRVADKLSSCVAPWSSHWIFPSVNKDRNFWTSSIDHGVVLRTAINN